MSTAVERMQQSVVSVLDPRDTTAAPDAVAQSGRMPEVHVANGVMDVRADADHVGPMAVRALGGFALTWGDRDHTRAYFARTDASGQAAAAPTLVREARTDEEDVWSPAVAFDGERFGMAWSDPANGRVRFARLDAQGQLLGRATIVHEGLESPLMTRVVWNGSEYGVAAGMAQGVYFARVNARGERVGDGVVVAEGTRVASLDGLSATPSGFQLSWRDGDERGALHQARIARNGSLVESTVVAPSSRGVRLASR